jgi:hypothetical protein
LYSGSELNSLIPILGLITSTILEFVSLWQVEIVAWNADENFEFPFFAVVVNKYAARDFWYAVNMVGWALNGGLSLCFGVEPVDCA